MSAKSERIPEHGSAISTEIAFPTLIKCYSNILRNVRINSPFFCQ